MFPKLTLYFVYWCECQLIQSVTWAVQVTLLLADRVPVGPRGGQTPLVITRESRNSQNSGVVYPIVDVINLNWKASYYKEAVERRSFSLQD